MMANQPPHNNQQLVYLIFAREVGPLVKAKYPQIQKVQFNKILGRIWNEMPGSERDKYHQKAEMQLNINMQKVEVVQPVIKEEPHITKGKETLTNISVQKLDNAVRPDVMTPFGLEPNNVVKQNQSQITQEMMKQYPMFPMYHKNLYPTLQKMYAGKTDEDIKLIAFKMFQEMILTEGSKSVEPCNAELTKIVAVESSTDNCEKTENILLREEETIPITQIALEEASTMEENRTRYEKVQEEKSKSMDIDTIKSDAIPPLIKEEPADESELLVEQHDNVTVNANFLDESTGSGDILAKESSVDNSGKESEEIEVSFEGSGNESEEIEISIEGTPVIGNLEQDAESGDVPLEESIFADEVVGKSLNCSSAESEIFDTENIAIESVQSLSKNVSQDDELSLAISTITENTDEEDNSETQKSDKKDADARVIFHNLGFFIKNEQNETNALDDAVCNAVNREQIEEKASKEETDEVNTKDKYTNVGNINEESDGDLDSNKDVTKAEVSEPSKNSGDEEANEEEEIEEEFITEDEATENSSGNIDTEAESLIEGNSFIPVSEIGVAEPSDSSLDNQQQLTLKERTEATISPMPTNPVSLKSVALDPQIPARQTSVAMTNPFSKPRTKNNEITSEMKSLIDKLVSKKTPDKDVIRQMVVKTRENMKPPEKIDAKNYRKTESITTTPQPSQLPTDSENNQTLYCYCRSPSSKDLIGCDYCPEWFHPTCLGLSKYELRMVLSLSNWKCPECIKKTNEAKKAVKAHIAATRTASKNKVSPTIHTPSPPGKARKLSFTEDKANEKTSSDRNDLEKHGTKDKAKCDTCHILVNEVKRRGAVIERLERRIAELESRE